MNKVIITPDYDGLYDDWFDPPMEIKMSCKNNEDIVINTTKGLEVVPIPHQIAYDPPMEIKMKMEQDIVINTTKGLEVVTIPEQTPHQIAYDLATEYPTTITTTGGSEVFNVPTQ